MITKTPIALLQHLAVGVVAFLAALLAWSLVHPHGNVSAAVDRGSHPAAKDFSLVGLVSRGPISLEQYRGRLVVLTFWASWCGPCKEELPKLERLADAHRSEPVVVIGVAVRDTPGASRRFSIKHKLSFENVSDPSGRVAAAYGVSGLPETFVISPDGHVVTHFRGYTAPAPIERVIASSI